MDYIKLCGVDKYACFTQMCVYNYCNNPKQWQLLSRIFSRLTSKVLHAQKNMLKELHGKLKPNKQQQVDIVTWT